MALKSTQHISSDAPLFSFFFTFTFLPFYLLLLVL